MDSRLINRKLTMKKFDEKLNKYLTEGVDLLQWSVDFEEAVEEIAMVTGWPRDMFDVSRDGKTLSITLGEGTVKWKRIG